ncbi:ubiquinol-cytochrome c reductase iron-sulfur subunit [Bacillus thermotolerans]|uniref:ubiquinol-cytochrome c reductase iron-sulfur subunit n=1 Tax=Bacillus thermotolerans TaxID=1221996 RepID=UPI00057F93FB|nr:ubiquinol-cytochrome c reductase iron-sulfur subunit [Bacillus thermotolerans]KKB38462.1 Menaquinone-cytochrome C reductase iron-sulfur subunit [Bacillus thermotolerans]
MSKQPVSRRQFLNYTLMGVGGFMAAGMLMPMVRFAIDPVLAEGAAGEFQTTNQKVDELTSTPVRVDFSYEQQDAWYTSEVTETAWVYKDENGEVVALSPICKHLGCTVNWEGDNHKNQFYCPCHGGLYEKNGNNVPGTPPTAPLDKYPTKVKDGFLQLGKPEPQTIA